MGLRGEYSVYRILVKLNDSSKSRAFGIFSIVNNLLSRKWQVLERNMHLNLYVIQFYMVIVCHLDKHMRVKAPVLLVLEV